MEREKREHEIIYKKIKYLKVGMVVLSILMGICIIFIIIFVLKQNYTPLPVLISSCISVGGLFLTSLTLKLTIEENGRVLEQKNKEIEYRDIQNRNLIKNSLNLYEIEISRLLHNGKEFYLQRNLDKKNILNFLLKFSGEELKSLEKIILCSFKFIVLESLGNKIYLRREMKKGIEQTPLIRGISEKKFQYEMEIKVHKKGYKAFYQQIKKKGRCKISINAVFDCFMIHSNEAINIRIDKQYSFSGINENGDVFIFKETL